MSDDSIFEKLKSKLTYVNGLLELKKSNDRYSTEQFNDLGVLSLRLSAVIKDFNASEKTCNDVKSALITVKKIEKQTKAISFNFIYRSSSHVI